MTTDSAPQIPSDQPVTIPRKTCELLALLDLTTGRRVLDVLLSQHSPTDGTVCLTKRAVSATLGIAAPAVTRGFRELAHAGAAWQVEGQSRRFQLHTDLIGLDETLLPAGAPALRAINPDGLKAQRRERYDALVEGRRPVGAAFVPPIPTNEPVSIPRGVFELLALLDLKPTGRRVLDLLLSRYSPEDGTAAISQREMVAALGASYPAVNGAFAQLASIGLAWGSKNRQEGRYQLHPLLTGGAVSSPVMDFPQLPEVDPDAFSALRRERYAVQIASLPRTA